MIDIQRIKEIIREYWENDEAIQLLINYLKGDKFRSALDIIMQSQEIDDIFEWIQAHGVDLNAEVGEFSDEISSVRQSSVIIQRIFFEKFSLASFEDEIRNEINYHDMNALIDNLLNDGNDFAQLYLILRVCKPSLQNVFVNDEIQIVMKDLTALGVNVEYLRDVMFNLLRWDE